MNEFKWMKNWHEWIETNELTVPTLSTSSWKMQNNRQFFFTISLWPTTWWGCGRQMKLSSRYCRAHTLSTSWSASSSKSGPTPVSFKRFLCEMELSRQSPAHFLDLILKKLSDPFSFFYDSYVKWSPRYRLVHMLSPTFRIEARNRERRSRTATLPEKT